MSRANQIRIAFHYFFKNVATASMASKETGIPQKNLCRYKRLMERNGILKEVRKGYCEVTHRLAWYLTTDPTKFPPESQLKLF